MIIRIVEWSSGQSKMAPGETIAMSDKCLAFAHINVKGIRSCCMLALMRDDVY